MRGQTSPGNRGSASRSWLDRFDDLDERVIDLLARWAVPLLRVSLGIVFLWFGALKIARVSPVADLVPAPSIGWTRRGSSPSWERWR